MTTDGTGGFQMLEETTRGVTIADGVVTTDVPARQARVLDESATGGYHQPQWAAPEPDVWRAPLLDRLDRTNLRSWSLIGLGVLAGAVVLAAMFVVASGGETAEVRSSGQADGAALAEDAASPSLSGETVPSTVGQPAPTLAVAPTVPESTTASTSSSTIASTTTTTAPTSTTGSTSTTVATTATEPTPAPTQAPTERAPTTGSTASSTVSTTSTTISTTASTVATTVVTQPLPGPAGNDAAVQQAVLAATNAARAEAGCPALRLDATLNGVADGHSEDMAARGYFSHTDPEGRGPGVRIDASGYPYRGWGENIAAGQSSAQEVVDDWMGSTGHRENILNCSFDELGVGYAEGVGTGRAPGRYWTQVFGTRR